MWATTLRSSRKSTEGSSHGDANQSSPRSSRVVADLDVLLAIELDAVAVLEVAHRRPTASRARTSRMCSGVEISGVRFWNFTA